MLLVHTMAWPFAGGGCGTCVNKPWSDADRWTWLVGGIVMAYLQFCAARHHLAEGNADPLNDCQQHRTSNRAIPCSLVASPDGQGATGEEASNDGVVGVLLLAHAFDGAVEGREQAAPHAKVSAQDGRAHLDGSDGAYAALTVG